ncbi:phosphoribosylformylglycinamidine synthase subunit PurS [Pseudodesulfovibrio thermohalotolerans]|uniref:phosphoribosylformylglycinamidine synthase subunit PurS n=1 Tax=Pseudodesulfovibrio thermohalotolerans TaxID=2880651 RepID=UPI0024411A05|nr:phosphoribosylformylglycinamidine synthase subunit PurS [Pseudodesulfovibrio thermohalotolerans]WFS63001.1 phosphoribosylformylglycinamidine synthase subunit PurS [Pseudodesulfovibrio thermohalotolerans]
MLCRVIVGLKEGVRDVLGERIARKVRSELGMDVKDVRIVNVFTLEGVTREQVDMVLDRAALHDPVLHEVSLAPLARDFDWIIEVGFRPGVTDNEGRTARETLGVVLGLSRAERESIKVYTSRQYLIQADLDEAGASRIAKDLLANELIQRYEYKSAAQWAKDPGFEAKAARVTGQASDAVATIPLAAMSDQELMDFSRSNTLALSLKELHDIRAYFADPAVRADREKAGLGADPTDAEIEVLAQTWSEHCKHKIFSAKIEYENAETGKTVEYSSLYKTFIQGSTRQIRERNAAGREGGDYCLSVFKDNAGVIRFSETTNVCVKMETHNSPSALDPYGGALTGIVGVNRDPMGTGMGANLLCNTDVFCFASPFHEGELPPRLLHPRRVFEGVREGVEHGGNKSGIPTVNGSIVFDERYLGKPLVYCGTIGTMPVSVAGQPSHEKCALPGDVIVMSGGRIGADGIHGATFSSEELHEGSPATAVQIGDPITQRKMYDFLMRARDLGLYNAITDNGAGGLSSSVGEMAEDSGGFDMDLKKAPLKYDGLRPWEILISEAQERMTMAVPPEKLDEFMRLSEEMDVESSALGTFTDSGKYLVRYGDKMVTYLDMDFLHNGVPQMELKAVWQRPEIAQDAVPVAEDQNGLLKDMLGRLNICSKEYVVRQYDHEVQGKSAVKPMVGVLGDGPSDAGVVRPEYGSDRGLVVSHGICPQFSDYDTYWMMANAIDEAVRNAVAVGGDVNYMAGVDNFCWCDPVQSESTPDGHYKLAQLVRANQALAHYCLGFGVPCVSGKDSMKNDYKGGGRKISIPPTVLFSVIGVIPDVNKCLTSDFKKPGDLVYVLGQTRPEMGGSEIADQLGFSDARVPQVDLVSAKRRYETVFAASQEGLISACHDCSDGGLGVALAEMCIGGRLGADVDLDKVPACGELNLTGLLYAESASRLLVSVAPADRERFENLFAGQPFACIGSVSDASSMTVSLAGRKVLDAEVEELAAAFKETLAW